MTNQRFDFLQDDLRRHPVALKKVLLLGNCNVELLVAELRNRGTHADHVVWDSHATVPKPEVDTSGYDAIVVGLTLRQVFHDAAEIVLPGDPPRNCIMWPRFVAKGLEEAFFKACSDAVRACVATACERLSGLLFFATFFEPQHNYLGTLLPCYSLSNPAWFVQQLNRVLEDALSVEPNAYLLEMNELADIVGRSRLQDDLVAHIGHAAYLYDMDEPGRIQRSARPFETYAAAGAIGEFAGLVQRRLEDSIAIIRAPLQTKAIIVDLDDTLWRGVVGDEDKAWHEFIEGWPMGMAEALLVCQARGGLLALCSRNDEQLVRRRFDEIWRGRLRLSDFASVKINYSRKSLNVQEILMELNLLPEHVLFVDDNPREVDEVRAAFPTLGTMSADHFDWRRRILLDPSFQVSELTDEARLRTHSVQSRIAATAERRDHSEAAWLESLKIRQTCGLVHSTKDPAFARSLELLNKTNQFNTNGRRWTLESADHFLSDGGALLYSNVEDRFGNHGIVAVAALSGDRIVQLVLSCRMFGLGIEAATIHVACEYLLMKHRKIQASIVDTGLNKTCHAIYEQLGFTQTHLGTYTIDTVPVAPAHVSHLHLPMPD